MGHIKRFCKEEVYCKYCKIYTHSTTGCRTYPATSSRKNTPEKRTPDDIDHEVNRRVREEVLRILTDISTNRRVANNQGTSHPKEDSSQKKTSNQPDVEQTTYQHIPEQRQETQNLIGDFQHPSEVLDWEQRGFGNAEQINGNHNQDPILNQQWEEPLHLQPPMTPMNSMVSQPPSGTTNPSNQEPTTRENTQTSATHRQVKSSLDEEQARGVNGRMSHHALTGTITQTNVATSATNRRVDQPNCTCCTCQNQCTNGNANQATKPVGGQRINLHAEYEDTDSGVSKFFHGKKHSDKGSSQDCKIIRILPDENEDFLDLVRDSVSAQTRIGEKPMFVKNYFMGDNNNWRTVANEKSDSVRHVEESRSQSSTAVQTAVSFLGEEDKQSSFLQTGISRVKSMSSNEVGCNTQSPVVVEPMKNGNSTGYSTHSFNLPEVQQNTPTGQQCKGFPDFTVPPPPIQAQTPQQGCSDREESAILRVIEKMTDTMDQQMRLSAMRTEYNMQQNTKMMDQFIKAQDRRDLDPALMDIPTFTGEDPEKCLEWIT